MSFSRVVEALEKAWRILSCKAPTRDAASLTVVVATYQTLKSVVLFECAIVVRTFRDAPQEHEGSPHIPTTTSCG